MLELIGLITVGFIGMLIWNAFIGDEVHIKFTVDNRDIIKYDKNKDKDLKEDSEKQYNYYNKNEIIFKTWDWLSQYISLSINLMYGRN